MRIAILGAGYVGLVSAACFASFGVQVTCIDSDREKIVTLQQGKIPIYEPELEPLLGRGLAAGALRFTTDLAAGLAGADAVMIAVGTPSRRGDGHADLAYVFQAIEMIAPYLHDDMVVVMKSTVPVGTSRRVQQKIGSLRPDIRCAVVANPEFLREGSAVNDFMRPDRIVIGVEEDKAAQVMRALYRPLYLNETPIVETGFETAELAKYATNAFLATKITFINEMADLCDAIGADVRDIARIMGLDGRIGKKFLHAGPGFGGSCLPKDTLALSRTAQEAGAPQTIVEAVMKANDLRKRIMAERIMAACGGSVAGKTIAILGVTFKPNTDDIRESVALTLIPALQQNGARIRATDPAGMANAQVVLTDVTWCDDAYSAATGADAVVIVTEWNDYRALDLKKLKAVMRGHCFVDLRLVYRPSDLKNAGMSNTSG